jgi:hypothetical protein
MPSVVGEDKGRSNGVYETPAPEGANGDTPHQPDRVGIVTRWLSILVAPESVVELRVLGHSPSGTWTSTLSGFFDSSHLHEMAVAALQYDDKSEGVYYTLNPLTSPLLARAANRMKQVRQKSLSAGDADVLCRRWLLVDVDPKRVTGVSSTDAEKEAARQVIEAVREHLTEVGWPTPIMADSGNGYHLLYRIDLPGDDGGVVANILKAVAARFDSDQVTIDQSVFNAARICKLYGCCSKKGDHVPDRPHRRSQILDIPGCPDRFLPDTPDLRPVPRELLEDLAAEAPQPSTRRSTSSASKPTGGEFKGRLKVGEWLTDRGIGFKQDTLGDGRTRYRLDHCPFDAAHTGKDVAIFQTGDGKLGARCFHNSCTGRGWQEFKRAIGKPEAHHWDPPRTPKAGGETPKRRYAWEVIYDYWIKIYQPSFKRKNSIYSVSQNREISRTEACQGASPELIELLNDQSIEALKIEKRDDLPRLFRNWNPTSWSKLYRDLPPEEAAAELAGGAEHEFRARVKAGLLRPVALGFTHHGNGDDDDAHSETDVQKRPLVDWCALLAGAGCWSDVRGHRIWSLLPATLPPDPVATKGKRRTPFVVSEAKRRHLRVSLRPEVFMQLGIDPELGRMEITRFERLAVQYGVGCERKVRGGATRAVELTRDFIAELFFKPENDWAAGDDEPADGHGDAWEGRTAGRTDGDASRGREN